MSTGKRPEDRRAADGCTQADPRIRMRRSASGCACGLHGQFAGNAAGTGARGARQRIAAVPVRGLLIASLVSAGAGTWAAAGGVSWPAGAVSAPPAAQAGRSSGPVAAALAAVWRTGRAARARESARGVLAQRRGLGGRGDIPRAVVFSPNGKILATADSDGTARLWDVATRRQIGAPIKVRGARVLAVAFSPGRKILATADSDGTARLWNVATRRRVGAPFKVGSTRVVGVAFSPAGKVLATAGEGGRARLWDVATRRRIGVAMI